MNKNSNVINQSYSAHTERTTNSAAGSFYEPETDYVVRGAFLNTAGQADVLPLFDAESVGNGNTPRSTEIAADARANKQAMKEASRAVEEESIRVLFFNAKVKTIKTLFIVFAIVLIVVLLAYMLGFKPLDKVPVLYDLNSKMAKSGAGSTTSEK